MPISHYSFQRAFSREAEHVKGFAKECAVVTHYRLRSNEEEMLLKLIHQPSWKKN